MENITLGEIATAFAFLAGLITSLGVLFNNLKKWLKSTIKEELEPVNEKLDKLTQADKDLELNEDKNFLVQFLKEAKDGNINETEKERFYEISKRYEDLGGNGYIKSEIEKLKKEGKL